MIRLLIGLAVVFSLSACGEPEQVVVYQQGKYQGKPDAQPWDNAPLAENMRGAKWTKGDRASWETAIKARQLTQHEHRRIYQ